MVVKAVATSIGNIAVWVGDLERAKRFYTAGLGFDVIATVQTSEVHEVIVGRQGLGSQLMLAHRIGQPGMAAPTGFWKTFVWSEDLPEDFAKAVAAGGTVVTEPTRLAQFHLTIAVVADPDGYLVELGQQEQS